MSNDCNSCPDWMLPVDTMQEHYDYEENSRYDQYDGLREVFYDEDPGCPDCHELNGICADCNEARHRMVEELRKEREEREAYTARTNDPNSSDYVPF